MSEKFKLAAIFLSSLFILSVFLFWGLISQTWHHIKHLWSLFLRFIKPFIELFSAFGNRI